jgi:hypothetical protein
MIENDTPVRLSVDSSTRALIIEEELGSSQVDVLRTTTISCSTNGRLTVGNRTFALSDDDGGRTTIMDVLEFTRLLKQLSSGNHDKQAPSYNRPFSSAADGSQASARSHYRRAMRIAGFVERIAYCFVVLSIAGGLLIAFSPDPSCGGGCDFAEKYPNVWSGVLIGLYGVLFLLAIAMLAAYVRGRAAESGA